MGKEKILRLISVVNVLFLVPAALLMVFVFLYSGIANGNLFNVVAVQFYGYILALSSGLLALKKKTFLWLSLLGWIVLAFGYFVEQTSIRNSNSEGCLSMRQDNQCVEGNDGTMNCADGSRIPGVFPGICSGIPK